MTTSTRWRRGAVGGAASLALAASAVAPAVAPAKTVYIPARWANGEVPWTQSRTRE
ncbi:hypothetical protein [Plantactinospora sp. DSM 117369]